MELDHWGLAASPFPSHFNPDNAYPSPSHKEALARISHLVDHRRRMGIVLGDRGLGKTIALRASASQLTRLGVEIAQVDAIGLTPREMIASIAEGLGAQPDPADDLPRLWRRLSDRLAQNRWSGKASVLFVDDASQAGPDIMRQLVRLTRLDTDPAARWTVLLAAESSHLARIDDSLLHEVELRIDLYPWNVEETEGFIQLALVAIGRYSPLFSGEAIARIHALTRGVPRHVVRLADYALLVGAKAQVDLIEPDICEQAFSENSWTAPVAAV